MTTVEKLNFDPTIGIIGSYAITIKAPLHWWKLFSEETKNLPVIIEYLKDYANYPLTKNDFDSSSFVDQALIDDLNQLLTKYSKTLDSNVWDEYIKKMPLSYVDLRIVTVDAETFIKILNLDEDKYFNANWGPFKTKLRELRSSLESVAKASNDIKKHDDSVCALTYGVYNEKTNNSFKKETETECVWSVFIKYIDELCCEKLNVVIIEPSTNDAGSENNLRNMREYIYNKYKNVTFNTFTCSNKNDKESEHMRDDTIIGGYVLYADIVLIHESMYKICDDAFKLTKLSSGKIFTF